MEYQRLFKSFARPSAGMRFWSVVLGEPSGQYNYPEFSSTEDFDVYVTREGPLRVCSLCGMFKNKTITNVRCHIESKHFPGIFNYTCNICSKVCNSKTSFRDHTQSCRKQMSELSVSNQRIRSITEIKLTILLFWFAVWLQTRLSIALKLIFCSRAVWTAARLYPDQHWERQHLSPVWKRVHKASRCAIPHWKRSWETL